MTVLGSFPKMWRSWGDGKKIVAILDLSLNIYSTDDLAETGVWMKNFSSVAGVPYINRKPRASGFQRRIVRLQQRSSCLHFARSLLSTVPYFTMGDW